MLAFISINIYAQKTQSFSYQAIIRGSNNELIVNKTIGMKVSLLQGSENGNLVYVENHNITSNVNGLISIAIGGGIVSIGIFTEIDWSKGPFFLKTETDLSGGTNFTITTTNQLLSVPFSNYSNNGLPYGGSEGQVITICNGKPTWTTGGICPGQVESLECQNTIHIGDIHSGQPNLIDEVYSIIYYKGGNGGVLNSQSISSTGVLGLTGNIETGNINNGDGSFIIRINGIAASEGIAYFSIKLGKFTCVLQRNVSKSTEVTKTGVILKNETWKSDSIYYLNGKVVVNNGVTLTIEPGTIVKGNEGSGSLASALVIARGAKIMAEGTASKPIIFTSRLDNIKTGELAGTNLTKTDNQKWGGLIILGKAPISAATGDVQGNIEGIPANESYGAYGGTDANDNSGVLTYVSVRHGGALIGEGNEINGITLGGVGAGTKIENIEVYATMDDGIEFYGGTVNVKNILIYYSGDDGLDIDQNYDGTIENFMVVQGDKIGTDKGLEVDGPENTTNTKGLAKFKNGICTTEGFEGTPCDFKDKAQGSVEMVTFDYQKATTKSLKIRANFDAANSCASKTDAYKNLVSGTLVFKNNKLFDAKSLVYTAVTACSSLLTTDDQTVTQSKIATTGAGAALDIATFAWTCAGIRGEVK